AERIVTAIKACTGCLRHPRADCGATRRPGDRLSCSHGRSSRACILHGLLSSATSRGTSTVATHSQSSRARHVSSWAPNRRQPLGECPLCVVGSTGQRNTLIFWQRWGVGHETATSHLL